MPNMSGKAQDRSRTSMSSAVNSGPGKGPKAKIGSPIELGLSSQSAVKDGSAAKPRQVTSEGTQRPAGVNETISSDRGSFNYR